MKDKSNSPIATKCSCRSRCRSDGELYKLLFVEKTGCDKHVLHCSESTQAKEAAAKAKLQREAKRSFRVQGLCRVYDFRFWEMDGAVRQKTTTVPLSRHSIRS